MEEYKKPDAPTKAELMVTKAKQLVDPDFKSSPSTQLGLCFRDTVLIRKVNGSENNTTEAGLILADTAENSNRPNMGIIEACGPLCSDHIMPGLKVLYSQYANLEAMIKGVVYHIISERDVYFALTSKTYTRVDPKSSEEVRREKTQSRQEKFIDLQYKEKEEAKNLIIKKP